MIDSHEIETKLLDFLKREVFAPEVIVTPETDLVASGFDSMSLVRVLLFIEQSYGFWIPEGEITADALQNAPIAGSIWSRRSTSTWISSPSSCALAARTAAATPPATAT